mgnify:FL=1
MEKEFFISGYCRAIDQTRMVELVTEDGQLAEVDCCYGSCVHEPNCQIAKQVREITEQ